MPSWFAHQNTTDPIDPALSPLALGEHRRASRSRAPVDNQPQRLSLYVCVDRSHPTDHARRVSRKPRYHWAMRGWARATVWISLAAVLASSAPDAAAETDPLLHAYDLAYNLDHDDAIETLRQIIAEDPERTDAHRGIAALTWLRILFLRGAVLVDAQLTATVRSPGNMGEPPPDLAEAFHTHIQRAIELAEAAVERAPDDPDSHYELGAAVALAASYKASIDGEGLRALRDAKRAYTAHQTVLELDPSRKDANLTLGIYRYLVSILPRAFRMMAYLVGFDGGREEALRLIEEAASYPGETEAEAKFALVLIYNREREFGKAQRVLTGLKRRYPRNRLVWLESASTWLRDERAFLASRDLARGFAQLAADDRSRMLDEDEVWRLKRGTARVGLGRIPYAREDLAMALERSTKSWIKGRAHVEFGKIADLEGNRKLAREQYDKGRKLCRKAKDRRCARAAETLKKEGYSSRRLVREQTGLH